MARPRVSTARRVALLAAAALGASCAAGAEPERTRGVELGAVGPVVARAVSGLSPVRTNQPSSPRGFTKVGEQLLFFTSGVGPRDGSGGLYRTDGTAGGTRLVSDREPLAAGVAAPAITELGGVGYWFQGDALWRSDGTPAGTGVVQRFTYAGSAPVAFRGALYFSVGGTLYRSNGTAGGTSAVVGLVAGAPLLPAGASLYFPCAGDGTGLELCATDGTSAGTRMLKELLPGAPGSAPTPLGVVGGRLLLSAAAPGPHRSLWATDGTDQGTVELLAATSMGDAVGDGIGLAAAPVVLGAYAYLPCRTDTTGLELCKTDGSLAGTSILDLHDGAGSSELAALGVAGAQLVFMNRTPATGLELWASNGTAAGTQLVRELTPGVADGVEPGFAKVGETLFFAGHTAVGTSPGLWRTDGTEAGTALVSELSKVGKATRAPLDLSTAAALDGALVFAADDGVSALEPWRSDGTEAGTALLRDLAPVRGLAEVTSVRAFAGAQYLTVVGSPASVNATWRSDGTAAGTAVLHAGLHDPPIALGPALYYLGASGAARALWRSDLSGAPPDKVRDLPANARELVPMGRRVAFTGATDTLPRGLWLSDGTAQGTAPSALAIPNAQRLSSLEGRVWMVGERELTSDALWLSDGTSAGTRVLKGLRADPTSPAADALVALGGRVLFAADNGATGLELWRSDGSDLGTELVLDLAPGTASSSPRQLMRWGSSILFSAAPTGAGPRELWRSDGTEPGTARVAAVSPEGPLVAWAGYVFFAGRDGAGLHLWRSDGTAAGTVRLTSSSGGLPLNPGEPILAGPQGPLVFAAEEPATGRELWHLPGPLAAPALLYDLASGPASSRPSALAVQGRALLLAADVGEGAALWRIDGVGSDGAAPELSCPVGIERHTTAEGGAEVSFPPVLAVDDSGTPPTLTFSAPSGAVFPVGSSTVEVTATDGSNNTSRCSFSIRVWRDVMEPLPNPEPSEGVSPGPTGAGCSAARRRGELGGGASGLAMLLAAALAGRRRTRPARRAG